MIFLRLLALGAGATVLILPPIAMAEANRTGMPAWVAVGGLAGLSLMALSFLYVAALAKRMRRSPQARMLGGLLLMIPIAAGLTMLATRTDEDLLWGSALLVSFSVLLFVSFVYPAAPVRRQRPMRQRERSEPVLAVIPVHPAAKRRGPRN
jgi:hypothetical protein